MYGIVLTNVTNKFVFMRFPLREGSSPLTPCLRAPLHSVDTGFVGYHFPSNTRYSVLILYASGSQSGCRGTLGCHLRYSGVPRAMRFLKHHCKINFKNISKP